MPAAGSCNIGEFDADGSRGARNAVDSRLAAVIDDVARRRYVGTGDRAGIQHVDTHRRNAIPSRDEPALDRKWADACKDIAAILRAADQCLVDHDLQEQVIDIRIRSRGRRYNGHLAGQRVRTAQSVDLAWVRGSHQGQETGVTGRGIFR